MSDIKLNVYDDDNKIIKTVEMQMIDLKFGTVRKLINLLGVDNIDDTAQLMRVVYKAWDQVLKVLDGCFPGMTEEDWDGVKMSELMPTFVMTLKYIITHLQEIPTDGDSAKNPAGE